MKTLKYSILTKQDLIEIIERIPINFVYDAIREIRDKAFLKESESLLQVTQKLTQLKEELQAKDYLNDQEYINQLNLLFSEAKEAKALYQKCNTRYEKLNKICQKIMEEN